MSVQHLINWAGPRLVGWDFTVELLDRLAHALGKTVVHD
jgi:hypothetical protein